MLTHLTYLLLDAARMGEAMDTAREKNAEHDSLYRGRSEESLSEVAPYIFSLPGRTEFVQWCMQQGWGDSWGIFVKCNYPREELHKHFRKFLMVTTEDGEELYFRFYDPRVLRIFLPTCDQTQLREFFGPVEYFVMEDEDPAFAIRFWLENWVLKSNRMKLDDFVGNFMTLGKASKEAEDNEDTSGDFNLPGRPSVPSTPSMPSAPSVPSAPSLPFAPSVPSTPSIPSAPSVPTAPLPSTPSMPAVPSVPSTPSMPSTPQIPSAPQWPSTSPLPKPSQPAMPTVEPPIPSTTKKKWNMFD